MDAEYWRKRYTELAEDHRILKAQVSGDDGAAQSWLQAKVERQRSALDVLNRKVRSQRFYLRIVNELGRGLTADEYLAAKEKASDPDRLLEHEELAAV